MTSKNTQILYFLYYTQLHYLGRPQYTMTHQCCEIWEGNPSIAYYIYNITINLTQTFWFPESNLTSGSIVLLEKLKGRCPVEL